MIKIACSQANRAIPVVTMGIQVGGMHGQGNLTGKQQRNQQPVNQFTLHCHRIVRPVNERQPHGCEPEASGYIPWTQDMSGRGASGSVVPDRRCLGTFGGL